MTQDRDDDLEVEGLDEALLEALAHGRRDLVEELGLSGSSAGEWQREAESAQGLSLELQRVFDGEFPPLPDFEPMIAGAMEHARPSISRAALGWGVFFGLAVSAAMTVLSAPSLSDAVGVVRSAWAVGGAVDQLVHATLPGAWTTVALLSFAGLMGLLGVMRWLIAPRRQPTVAASIVLGASVLALGAVSGPGTALAQPTLEGEWPEAERAVSVDATRAPLAEVLQEAAADVDLGLIHTLPDEVATREVTLRVQDASLEDVVGALLAEDRVMVRRSPTIVSVRPASPNAAAAALAPPDPAAPAPAASPPEPVASQNIPDAPVASRSSEQAPIDSERVSFGGDVEVREGERVRSVVTMGGDAIIGGYVQHDVVTMGGDARVSGEVAGDVVTMGGTIEILPGGVIRGDRVPMGGSVRVRHEDDSLAAGPTSEEEEAEEDEADEPTGIWAWLEELRSSVAEHAVLFVLGLLLLSFAPERMATLHLQLRERWMKSFAFGALGGLGAILSTILLAITIIGIPGALLVLLGSFAALYIGFVGVAILLGRVLPVSGNAVAQLGAGIAILFLLSILPGVGELFRFLLGLLGFGAVVLTRFGRQPRDDG